jgi:hypothetical protein
MRLTLEKDHTQGQDDALLDIYRKLRPGEPPTKEAAQALLDNLYFNPKRYDLAKVGRYKLGKKLGVEATLSASTLSIDDIVATIRTSWPCTPARRPCPVVATARRSSCASRPTTSTTSATVVCAASASSSRTRSARACPGWSASCASG